MKNKKIIKDLYEYIVWYNHSTRTLLYGTGLGVVGLGLQHMNPVEPIQIMGWDAVYLGLCIIVIANLIYPMIVFLIKIIIDLFKKNDKNKRR